MQPTSPMANINNSVKVYPKIMPVLQDIIEPAQCKASMGILESVHTEQISIHHMGGLDCNTCATGFVSLTCV
jgi:hypothetical protein